MIGMKGRLRAQSSNLEMVKYCVANECPIDKMRVHAAENGHLECLKYLREEAKRLGIFVLPIG